LFLAALIHKNETSGHFLFTSQIATFEVCYDL